MPDPYRSGDFVCGVALDGVCADFVSGIRPLAAERLGVDASTLCENPSFDFREWNLGEVGGFDGLYRWAVEQRDLFEVVPPINGAAVALRRLDQDERIRIRIITRVNTASFDHVAIQKATEWLDRNDFPSSDLCFMNEKAAVGADLYVESNRGDIEYLRGAGKQVIAFGPHVADMGSPRANDWTEAAHGVVEAVQAWSEGREPANLTGG